jgi:hypothetical protein
LTSSRNCVTPRAAIGIQCQENPHAMIQLWNRLSRCPTSCGEDSGKSSKKRQKSGKGSQNVEAGVRPSNTLTMASIDAEVFEQHKLVCIRGQRRTLHLYDPARDWSLVCACLSDMWRPVKNSFDIDEISEATIERAQRAMDKRKIATCADLAGDGVVSASELKAVEVRSHRARLLKGCRRTERGG